MSNTPHDALVREVFAHPENARGELQHLLPPALCARIDWASLELVPGNFVDEMLQQSESDLLFKVRLDGCEAFLYLLFEHQSSPDAWIVFRQLKYELRFWDTWLQDHPDAKRLPVVIPLLLCHAPSGWSVPTRFEDLLDIDKHTRELVLDFVPRFRTLLDDLSVETDEALRSRAMTALGRVVLWCLKTARNTDELVDGMVLWADLIRAIHSAPDGAAALARIWQYLLAVHEEPVDRVLPALAAALKSEEKQGMASMAQQLIEKGERTIVQRQLQRRFGPLPAEVHERIEHAAPAELERWADRVLTAATLGEVLDEPL